MNIGVIDSPCGNVFSIQNALDYLGFDFFLIKQKKDFLNVKKLILPGVGNFGYLNNYLKEKEIFDSIHNHINTNGHFLGICLGSQILCNRSEEDKMVSKGLSFINCDVLNLKRKNKEMLIPNMGWNKLDWGKKQIFGDETKLNNFYFCHTYFMNSPKKNIIATIGSEQIPVIVKHLNAFGVQFHPEKSGKNGLLFIEKFLEWEG